MPIKKKKPASSKKQNFKEVQPTARIDMSVNTVPDENPRNLWGIFDGDFTNPLPEQLKYYLECLRKGFNFWAALLFEFIRRRDLFIKSVCQTRKLPITSKEWIIEDEEETASADAVEFLKELFGSDWFVQFVADCVEANISGLSIFEINWKVEEGKVTIDNLKLIPNHLVLFDDINQKYIFLDIANNDGNVLKTIGINQMEDRIDFSRLKTIDLPDIKKLEVHALDGYQGNGLMNGFIDGMIWAYLRKSYAKKDFAIFLEKWADPPVSAAYENYLGDEGRKNAKEAAESFGRSKWTSHSKDIDFKVHDESQKAATSQLFMDYIKDEKEDIAVAILGQTLTTSIGDKGSYAAADVHDRVRKDLQLADMIIVSLAANKLIRLVCDMNFTGLKKYPKFKYVSQVDIEFKKALAVIVRDLRVAGFKPVAEEISKTFDFTLIETTPVGGAPDPNNDPGNDTPPEPDKKPEDKTDDTKLSMTIQELTVFAKEFNKADSKNKIALLLKKIFNENKP